MIPFVVLGKKYQMRILAHSLSVFHGVRGDVRLHSQYGLYPLFPAFFIKIDYAIHRTVIGYCKRAHLKLFRPSNEILYPRRAIQKAVLGMNMKMYEIGHFALSLLTRRRIYAVCRRQSP